MHEQLRHYEDKLKYEIDSWDLSEALKNEGSICVVDTRSPEAYNTEHIPSAINVPHREMTEAKMGGFDRDCLYVTYCDGIGCNASTKGARNLVKLGFLVKELIGLVSIISTASITFMRSAQAMPWRKPSLNNSSVLSLLVS